MERELVEQAQRGDQDAFAALVHLSADRLYGIAYRLLRDMDRAEDALQNALVDMWHDLPDLRDPDRFEAWTFRMVVRASYREARRERRSAAQIRRLRLVDPNAEPVEYARIEMREELESAFRGLTPEHRAVVVLHFYLGLPVSEVAEVLDIPAGTAGSRLHYAVRDMRAALEAGGRAAVAWRHTA